MDSMVTHTCNSPVYSDISSPSPVSQEQKDMMQEIFGPDSNDSVQCNLRELCPTLTDKDFQEFEEAKRKEKEMETQQIIRYVSKKFFVIDPLATKSLLVRLRTLEIVEKSNL